MQKTLLVGYGNIDRQDDGVAWHILTRLSSYLNIAFPDDPSEEVEFLDVNPGIFFSLQLTPEFSEIISKFEKVCFIDAHTGNLPEELNFQTLEPEFQNSPFTHHLTPQSCLALSSTLYGNSPFAVLVSVRGYEFNFSQSLSSKTELLVDSAVSKILDWIRD